ncbi:MAG: 16S rRNA processing protein RimM [Spirochaetota bacterium]|nr:MAG: 16S rRNA processing protein RimM [Spirochaetota bacterium]
MVSKTDYLIIGRVLRPFGLKGELKLLPITDHIKRFINIKEVYLQEEKDFRSVEVEGTRITDRYVFIKLKNFDSKTEVEPLRDNLLYVTRGQASPLEEGSYYYYDILNCTVKSVNGEFIGKVFDIQNAGSCDVYFVRSSSEKQEYRIPAVSDVIKRIDISQKEIIIDVIDGLM